MIEFFKGIFQEVGRQMALFGNWAELTVTNDVRRYGSILEKLDSAGIAYREKIQQLGHGDRRMGNLGAGGGSGVLYQVFVRKTDLEKALLLLR